MRPELQHRGKGGQRAWAAHESGLVLGTAHVSVPWGQHPQVAAPPALGLPNLSLLLQGELSRHSQQPCRTRMGELRWDMGPRENNVRAAMTENDLL